MQTRILGRTGLSVSVLGFGCGAVGGLMVRGDPADQERAVARAVDRGVIYFDTAPLYGDGQSETNLGRVLAKLKPNVLVGTKARVRSNEKADIARAIEAGIDASLRRLGRDHVDLFQLHNPIAGDGSGEALTPEMVLDQVAPAFDALRRRGKTRFVGFTAVGETSALHAVVGSGAFDTAQVCYNMLNPSAGGPVPANHPGQDYGDLLGRIQAAGMGAIGIRVLAGGALSGTAERHPNASPPPEPIGSGPDYAADLARAQTLRPLIEEAGAATLAEVAIRFAISHPATGTALIGIATPEQFEVAVAAAEKGGLPDSVLGRLRGLQEGFAA
ncbi:MAG TPA: aldo/keto reductase [Acetobacteraceae bacterium]|nr:aldo/keto reductase [Acetobacteraceae bacterium]